jgi:hypothetical protein
MLICHLVVWRLSMLGDNNTIDRAAGSKPTALTSRLRFS